MKYAGKWFLGVACACALILSGCAKQTKQGGSNSALLGSVSGEAAGMKWSVPKTWTDEGERTMRVASYAISSAQGDSEGGECGVFYFGSGQGGSIDDNIQRWVGQFERHDSPVQSQKEIGDIKVTTVQIIGTYLAPGGPMMQSTGSKENYRLLGAIAEAPQGRVFFKLTGPAKTVAAAEPEFEALIGSFRKI
jgi:hypothetical protein